MTKLLLVDLDNTIREPLSGNKFISHPRDQRIMAGADKAIAHYFQRGWSIVGISNQGGIASGYKSMEDALAEQKYTLELFPEISYILFCPDFEGRLLYKVSRIEWHNFVGDQGEFRKPAPGMLHWARLNPPYFFGQYFDVALIEACWYIGDRAEDVGAAEAAGVNYLDAAIWRQRFLPGMHEFRDLTSEQIGFLEGIVP